MIFRWGDFSLTFYYSLLVGIKSLKTIIGNNYELCFTFNSLEENVVKKCLFVFLALILLMSSLVSCSKTKELNKDQNNNKLVGPWILVNETNGSVEDAVYYWVFTADNIMHETLTFRSKSEKINPIFFEDVPFDIKCMEFEFSADKGSIYEYSYTDGYGLECQNPHNVVKYIEEEGYHFKFLNENHFIITTDVEIVGAYYEFHGYRLKEPLKGKSLDQITKEEELYF